MSRPAHIEVRPVSDATLSPTQRSKPLSRRPHYVRMIGGNGEVEWHSENYHDSSSAMRAAKKHAKAEGLAVVKVKA